MRSAPADGADAKVQYLCPADSHAPQVLPPQMRVDAIYTTVLAKWTAAAPAGKPPRGYGAQRNSPIHIEVTYNKAVSLYAHLSIEFIHPIIYT